MASECSHRSCTKVVVKCEPRTDGLVHKPTVLVARSDWREAPRKRWTQKQLELAHGKWKVLDLPNAYHVNEERSSENRREIQLGENAAAGGRVVTLVVPLGVYSDRLNGTRCQSELLCLAILISFSCDAAATALYVLS